MATIGKCLVDTGSEFTWVRHEILESLGVEREHRDRAFQMANGQIVTRDIGYAIIQVGDSATIDEVVFGTGDDQNLLGARSLEGLRFLVDPHNKRLLRGGPAIVASPQPSAKRKPARRRPAKVANLIENLRASAEVVAVCTPTFCIESLVRNPRTGLITTAPIGNGVPLTAAELDALEVPKTRLIRSPRRRQSRL